MTQKYKKLISKIIIASISILLLALLFQQLEYSKIKASFSILLGSNGLILYILLSLLSLICRSERFYILHKVIAPGSGVYSRLIILAATSLRNASMSFIPLRLGELMLPSLLKLTYPKESIAYSLQPIWISIIFDFCALLILGLVMFCLIVCCSNNTIQVVDLSPPIFSLSSIKYLVIFSFVTAVVISLLNITKLLKNLLRSRFISKISFSIYKYKFDPLHIANQIPVLNSSISLRVLALSMTIRFSKYLSLASLFFSISESTDPTLKNTFIILVGFIGAELFSSLPGSGVMGFGGYELTFKFILNTFSPEIVCTLSLITSIHLVGFLVEITSCLVVVPCSVLLFKLKRKA